MGSPVASSGDKPAEADLDELKESLGFNDLEKEFAKFAATQVCAKPLTTFTLEYDSAYREALEKVKKTHH